MGVSRWVRASSISAATAVLISVRIEAETREDITIRAVSIMSWLVAPMCSDVEALPTRERMALSTGISGLPPPWASRARATRS